MSAEDVKSVFLQVLEQLTTDYEALHAIVQKGLFSVD